MFSLASTWELDAKNSLCMVEAIDIVHEIGLLATKFA
jgi:hypothetical protein